MTELLAELQALHLDLVLRSGEEVRQAKLLRDGASALLSPEGLQERPQHPE